MAGLRNITRNPLQAAVLPRELDDLFLLGRARAENGLLAIVLVLVHLLNREVVEHGAAGVVTLLPLRGLEPLLLLRRLGQARGLALALQKGPLGRFGGLLGRARTVLRTQARGR